MPRVRAGILVIVAALAASFSLSATEGVDIDGGSVTGTAVGGVRIFKGVPDAAPPVGARRWTPPQAVVARSGVRDGSSFGAECPQTPYPTSSIYVRPIQKQSEDCLFLNVWTPAKAGDKRPVLVWIHGGALTRGSSIIDTRDGVPLAKKGIVLRRTLDVRVSRRRVSTDQHGKP